MCFEFLLLESQKRHLVQINKYSELAQFPRVNNKNKIRQIKTK